MNSVRSGPIGWLIAAGFLPYPGYRCLTGDPIQYTGGDSAIRGFVALQDHAIGHIGMIGTGLLLMAMAGAIAYYAIFIVSR